MMNWFKKEMPVVQMPAEAPPVVDIEKKIADGVKAALYSAKHKEVQAKLKELYLIGTLGVRELEFASLHTRRLMMQSVYWLTLPRQG